MRMHQEKKCYLGKKMILNYCSPSRRRSEDPDKLPSSPNWTAIRLGFPIFSKGIYWGVGNGSRKNLWTDSWIRGHSLRELIEGLLTRDEMNLAVSDLRHEHEWNWDSISFDLPLPGY